MRIPSVLPAPDERSARTIKRAKVTSYVCAALAALVLSLAPSVLGDPQQPPWHVLLHVVRPIVAGVLVAAALAVQVIVGVRWRRNLRSTGAEAQEPPQARTPADR